MNEPEPSPAPVRARFRWRQLWFLALSAWLMNGVLSMVYASVAYLNATQAAVGDPALTKLLQGIVDRLGSASDAFRNNDTELQTMLDQMAPIFTRMNWFSVTVVSSILGFSLVGFLYVRLSGKLEWAGALPLLALLGGQSPSMVSIALAQHGVTSAQLSFPEQAAVLAIQVLTVYGCGALGWRLRRRRMLKLSGLA